MKGSVIKYISISGNNIELDTSEEAMQGFKDKNGFDILPTYPFVWKHAGREERGVAVGVKDGQFYGALDKDNGRVSTWMVFPSREFEIYV